MQSPSSLTAPKRSRHYLARCRQRAIPVDADRVLIRFGVARLLGDGSMRVHLRRLDAWNHAQSGVPLWQYCEVVVIVSKDGVAVTTYREDEEVSR